MTGTEKIKKTISPWFDSVPDTKRYSSLLQNISCDVAIVGGGVVGIVAAYHLAKKGKKVVLLEKNHLVTGDSGLTTGFLTRVPDTSIAHLAEQYGESFTQDLFKATTQTQQIIFSLIKEHNIECEFKNCSSYFGSYAEDSSLANEALTYVKADPKGTNYLTQKKEGVPFANSVEFNNEGQVHIRKFLFGLLEKAKEFSLQIFEETEVTALYGQEHKLATSGGATVTAEHIIVCVGNPDMLLPELAPLLEQRITEVIAAEYKNPIPLSNNLFWDTFDPYFYYRKINENTLIVGGCDRLITAPAVDAVAKLEVFLKQYVPGEFTITNRWSGSIFHTKDGLPYAFEHPHYKGMHVAMGFGGNGLIFGSLCAQTLAAKVLAEKHAGAPLFSLQRTKITIAPVAEMKAPAALVKKFIKVATTDAFKNKKVMCAMAGTQKIALFNVDGKYYALNNECTHQGGSLSDGAFDGKTIECPLHGAQFEVTTGTVKNPPAVRNQKTYPVRVTGNNIEIEIETTADGAPIPAAATAPMTKKTYWGLLFKVAGIALLFWLAQFALQYFWLAKGQIEGSLVRSFALAGATLIGSALLSSIIFRFYPRLAMHWRTRRYIGVSGFVLIFFHVLSVTVFLFEFDYAAIYYSFNPIENPIIFGSIAFSILFVMAATSTDWAVQKLTPKIWKFIHRFVYIAYISMIFHFILINPALLKNVAGYLLLAVTGATLLGQLYWYLNISWKRRFMSVGTFVGLGIIVATAIVGYLAYSARFAPLLEQTTPPALAEEESLDEAVEKMKEFMKTNPPDSDVAKAPIPTDKTFAATILKKGAFQNINYMTSGGVSLQKKGEDYFIVFDERFDTPDGPDLQIYLTRNSEPTKRNDITEGLLLGKLKSIKGKQVYALPAGTDITRYNSLSIHCKAFNVPWSYAKLL